MLFAFEMKESHTQAGLAECTGMSNFNNGKWNSFPEEFARERAENFPNKLTSNNFENNFNIPDPINAFVQKSALVFHLLPPTFNLCRILTIFAFALNSLLSARSNR
jgi:hypothetical protein